MFERIELVVDQFPAGFTQHAILGARDGDPLSLDVLHQFEGNTASLQTLTYTLEPSNRDFRYIRIVTYESPSWVAWREVRFFRSGVSAIDDFPSDASIQVNVFPNPTSGQLTLSPDGDNLRGFDFSDAVVRGFNTLGQGVFYQTYSIHKDDQKAELDVSSLSDGIYLLQIQTAGYTIFKKISIAR